MSNWLQRALLRSEYRDEVLLARQDMDDDEQNWETILATGLLAEARSARQPWCPDCGDEPSELTPIPSGASIALYLNCPGCGLVAVDEDALRRWRFCFERLSLLLREQLALTGAMQELIPRRLWQLGRRSNRGAAYPCLLARGLHRRDALELLGTMKLPPRALWLVPAKLPGRAVVELLRGSVVPLVDLWSWQGNAIRYDTAALEEPCPAESPVSPPPRPRKRAGRAAAIEALKGQLAEHLRAARDHAQAALDLRGEAVLLPRPSQKDLAKLTGLKEVTVSRCLRDPAARELRMFWELADDLDAVLRLSAATLR